MSSTGGLVLRSEKGSELTHNEVDGNFIYLKNIEEGDFSSLNNRISELEHPNTIVSRHNTFKLIENGVCEGFVGIIVLFTGTVPSGIFPDSSINSNIHIRGFLFNDSNEEMYSVDAYIIANWDIGDEVLRFRGPNVNNYNVYNTQEGFVVDIQSFILDNGRMNLDEDDFWAGDLEITIINHVDSNVPTTLGSYFTPTLKTESQET